MTIQTELKEKLKIAVDLLRKEIHPDYQEIHSKIVKKLIDAKEKQCVKTVDFLILKSNELYKISDKLIMKQNFANEMARAANSSFKVANELSRMTEMSSEEFNEAFNKN